ncbi:hypothetical protein [Solitalea lacus]|uniref:hypothetical protein n=1 Tax=Solitalea lacus TaxID=2911172 RepID=UPI001EDBC51D|nr:hypothetical protein [Solitalea lacus]UKJ08593.1 hypothetical protein L2B55_05360 [Solitalea lacus]
MRPLFIVIFLLATKIVFAQELSVLRYNGELVYVSPVANNLKGKFLYNNEVPTPCLYQYLDSSGIEYFPNMVVINVEYEGKKNETGGYIVNNNYFISNEKDAKVKNRNFQDKMQTDDSYYKNAKFDNMSRYFYHDKEANATFNIYTIAAETQTNFDEINSKLFSIYQPTCLEPNWKDNELICLIQMTQDNIEEAVTMTQLVSNQSMPAQEIWMHKEDEKAAVIPEYNPQFSNINKPEICIKASTISANDERTEILWNHLITSFCGYYERFANGNDTKSARVFEQLKNEYTNGMKTHYYSKKQIDELESLCSKYQSMFLKVANKHAE